MKCERKNTLVIYALNYILSYSRMLRCCCKPLINLVKHSHRNTATLPTIAASLEKTNNELKHKKLPDPIETEKHTLPLQNFSKKSALVAAAFASLKDKEINKRTPSEVIDSIIAEASSAEEILSVVNVATITRRQALKILSILAEWCESGKEKIQNYESNPKFISLCKLLGKVPNKALSEIGKENDLSLVMNVTGDDEAARLVSTISLQQMIKVLSSLATKKRRSTPLLKSLAFNIRSSTAKTDIKQAADILFSMATLNFLDQALLEKVSTDLKENIPNCQKTAVIGSIATSLGLLRFQDSGILHLLCDWVAQNKDICRVQDMTSLLQTLATVNVQPLVPENLFEVIRNNVKEEDCPSISWLDIIWSLVILNKAEKHHLSSVLSSEFINKLTGQCNGVLNISSKKKLLNINGAAKWTKGYNGPLIDESSEIRNVTLLRSKEKQVLVNNVLDTLSNLLPSSLYLRSNVDTGMGFVLDAECLIDPMMTPLQLIEKKSGNPIQTDKPSRGTRVAVMVWDYHDFTRGKQELVGIAILISRLISFSGYKLLSVPYTEYNQLEKLSVKVQYLENKLRSLVRPG